VIFQTDDGLVMVDPGVRNRSERCFEAVREQLDAPLHTAIYTHGHVDHVFGVDHYAEEARERGWRPPRVVAHEDMPACFDRYRRTGGYNAVINSRQFRGDGTITLCATKYWSPDVTYTDRLDVTVGGQRHARGETDDATWVFAADRHVLCASDLFVWVAPNAGNPQKVQRYAGEWAEALRAMATEAPELLDRPYLQPVYDEPEFIVRNIWRFRGGPG
jgi:glyoxylase-like metal-dependent hydrolase (beta-lactamase superfamily II)